MNKFNSFILILAIISIASSKNLFDPKSLEIIRDEVNENGEQDFCQYKGGWDDSISTQNGDFIDVGEFHASVEEYDNGEYQVTANYKRIFFNRVELDDDQYNLQKVSDSGEFIYVGNVKNDGPVTQLSVSNIVKRKLRKIIQYFD
ncbi:hypothetical protein TTHERM_00123610 (macronuclear) [Tetrahymena thermophila SB210]|uniref:Transmembrane protein n=1 Tax=Tetrahymena thermophila (strain SB210) TaxID=312017 RepID=Q22YQ8_TETTS|nr:hypothetical protein TTHERM_00123610 [Tetrahymena thermophila SB210]EAR90613.1 hypothetical protein TTHERM_00123610 [Tetrahymena thermophila SB210]|eukprot:XP_001010858.1 hypothetical protein TTHERM_00123610 [Tetrahymena thermophila SB210]